jgi:hypothetical protein
MVLLKVAREGWPSLVGRVGGRDFASTVRTMLWGPFSPRSCRPHTFPYLSARTQTKGSSYREDRR